MHRLAATSGEVNSYIGAVKDACSSKIVGYPIESRMKAFCDVLVLTYVFTIEDLCWSPILNP